MAWHCENERINVNVSTMAGDLLLDQFFDCLCTLKFLFFFFSHNFWDTYVCV